MGYKIKICLIIGINLIVLTSLAQAQEKQWLQYRSSRDSWQLLGELGALYPEVTSEKPQGVKLPDFKCKENFFARWPTPMAAGGGLWLAFDRKSNNGPHDLLYIDLNGNGSLADESALEASKLDERNATFDPVKILFEDEDGPITYHLNVKFYRSPNRASLVLWPAGWYEGTIKVAGVNKNCALIDYNSNGTFNDTSPNPADCDRIRIGKKGEQGTRYVGNFIEIDNVLYRPEIARDGACIKLTKAEDVKFGNVRLPQNIKEFSAGGENGLFKLKPENGSGPLPVGKYRINQWTIERDDEEGKIWIMQATCSSDKGDFNIVADKETELSIGEPIVSRLQVNKRDLGYSFNQSLAGRFGERIELTCNGSQPPAPKLNIKSQNGSYDRTFSFEYG